MDIVLIVLAFICVLISIAGSILPALPGPSLAFIGLCLAQGSSYREFSTSFLIATGVAMLVIGLLDYLLPPMITKHTGGSRYATIGSIIGMLAGIFLAPLGIITGMLLGAFIGELIFARQGAVNAFKAALGAFTGFVLSTGIKLLYCFFILYHLIF